MICIEIASWLKDATDVILHNEAMKFHGAVYSQILFSPLEANGSAGYTVEEAIEKMGFGWFQIKLLALCGVAWVR